MQWRVCVARLLFWLAVRLFVNMQILVLKFVYSSKPWLLKQWWGMNRADMYVLLTSIMQNNDQLIFIYFWRLGVGLRRDSAEVSWWHASFGFYGFKVEWICGEYLDQRCYRKGRIRRIDSFKQRHTDSFVLTETYRRPSDATSSTLTAFIYNLKTGFPTERRKSSRSGL